MKFMSIINNQISLMKRQKKSENKKYEPKMKIDNDYLKHVVLADKLKSDDRFGFGDEFIRLGENEMWLMKGVDNEYYNVEDISNTIRIELEQLYKEALNA